jgi:hypothetical protein
VWRCEAGQNPWQPTEFSELPAFLLLSPAKPQLSQSTTSTWSFNQHGRSSDRIGSSTANAPARRNPRLARLDWQTQAFARLPLSFTTPPSITSASPHPQPRLRRPPKWRLRASRTPPSRCRPRARHGAQTPDGSPTASEGGR